jgi:hypothetical protein
VSDEAPQPPVWPLGARDRRPGVRYRGPSHEIPVGQVVSSFMAIGRGGVQVAAAAPWLSGSAVRPAAGSYMEGERERQRRHES